MGSENEPAKLLLPYLQRANELQKHQPMVAYYCRLYAMERGLKIPQKESTKMINSLLVSLMNQLEKDKNSMKLGLEDNLYVDGFALNVFAKADKQDRAGRADLNTAKTFYAASIFFEILNQFGELQPDIEQKQKYAVWKAADIRKALKEGKKPEPGPPGGDKDLTIPSSTTNGAYELGHETQQAYHPGSESDASAPIRCDVDHQPSVNLTPSSSYSTADHLSNEYHQPPPVIRQESYRQKNSYPQPPPPVSKQENSAYPQTHHQSYQPEPRQTFPPTLHAETTPTPAQTFQYDSNYEPQPERIAEAHKAARFAVGALAFDDVAVAVDFLKKSLELLTNPSASH
ncbi:PREDICTED: protein HOMOLOG OF MAMMALIAN LYST-INTERACTING PROTEIN 5-like isoform X1 [Nelumbo nucifera]|uniref:Protein HOMOLOG OF MAMMALIAN LYST-INTERACTING PROTEIN 5-like isoform X1 n=1 Tax=Nelumbo nucifera TaxID=4432 RepID=A0A1U8B335_NELNU|nr:PREDICTED: protein HOMOLOG OF MAMMALIAN LYST-INTERACTING PROTEIN 5-like isoform X1 [Nelumbo nucifera]